MVYFQHITSIVTVVYKHNCSAINLLPLRDRVFSLTKSLNLKRCFLSPSNNFSFSSCSTITAYSKPNPRDKLSILTTQRLYSST